jgi:hypothetical protein
VGGGWVVAGGGRWGEWSERGRSGRCLKRQVRDVEMGGSEIGYGI